MICVRGGVVWHISQRAHLVETARLAERMPIHGSELRQWTQIGVGGTAGQANGALLVLEQNVRAEGTVGGGTTACRWRTPDQK